MPRALKTTFNLLRLNAIERVSIKEFAENFHKYKANNAHLLLKEKNVILATLPFGFLNLPCQCLLNRTVTNNFD